MTLHALVATLAAGSGSDAGPVQGSQAAVVAGVVAYLTAHDLPTVAELRALAPAPDVVLMTIADDARADGLCRARAVAALRLLPSLAVQDFLARLVQAKAKASDATDRLLVRRAAVTLGWMAAPFASARLALLFENDNADVRLDAVIGIGLTRSADAAAILRKQLAVETVARVRDQIDRQLRVLEPVPPEQKDSHATPGRQPMRSAF